MTLPTTIDWTLIHPICRAQFTELNNNLARAFQADAAPQFAAFEGYRTPGRQAELYRQRPSVTKADAWQSAHQYGLAIDFVLWTDSGWTWSAEHHAWNFLHEQAAKVGLTAPIAWDPAHIQHPIWLKVRKLLVK